MTSEFGEGGYAKVTLPEWYTTLIDKDMADGLHLVKTAQNNEELGKGIDLLQRVYTYFRNLAVEVNTDHMLKKQRGGAL